MRTDATQPRNARRGTVLIVTMVIVFALASIVLTITRSATVDLQVAANGASMLQADAIQRGAEQYLLGMLTEEKDTFDPYDNTLFEAVPVGSGYFWVVRPEFDDESLPAYGLVDESSKLDLNAASYDTLARLPGLTEDIAASVVDWRDADDTPTQSRGAETSVYMGQPNPHPAKNADFECVEELLNVYGMTPAIMYGDPAQQNAARVFGNDRYQTQGVFDDFTVWSHASVRQGNQTVTRRGRVNINQAPREVLLTLPNLTESDVDALIARRTTAVQSDPYGTTWVQQALPEKAAALNNLITGRGLIYSADIVAVSGDGRAFKRVRVVIDCRTASAPKFVYRRDITDRGFPLDRSILESLRAGRGVYGTGVSGFSGGMTR